jgi:hypothetical protein
MPTKYCSVIVYVLFLYVANAQTTVLPTQSNWSYYDQGDIGTSLWIKDTFNDNSWNEGLAEFGYGDGDENTVVSYGSSASNKYFTTYFRKSITIPYISGLICRIKIDDGSVVYINGIEVFRNNLPTGIIGYNSLALNTSNENEWHSFVVPMSFIDSKTLLFAVEMHQAGASSSDISFDLEAILDAEPPPPNLYINEIMASNEYSLIDQNGGSNDWIELYSSLPYTVNLKGYYFSDEINELDKFEIENDLFLQPNEYKIFWLSGEENLGQGNLNFKLSSSGEWLGLIAPNGTSIVDSVTFGKQKTDVSYGRVNYSPSSFKYLEPSSPYVNNSTSTSYLGFLEPPLFSVDAGFYESEFHLSLSTDEMDATIIYTIDGSYPTSNNLNPQAYTYKNIYPYSPGDPNGNELSRSIKSNEYTQPIIIKNRTDEVNGISKISTTVSNYNPQYFPNHRNEKATIVVARVEKEGFIPSESSSNTYFFENKKLNLPIISLGFNEEEMFGYRNGISVPGVDFDNFRSYDQTTINPNEVFISNYFRKGIEHEIHGSFEYFEDLNRMLSQNIGIRVHGNLSRSFAQKSLRLSSRSIYGKKTINHVIFKDLEISEFKRLILRNSGTDFFSTKIRDAVLQKAVSHLRFETEAFQPAILYLNAEYWGLVNIRERQDDNYYYYRYGIPVDSIDVLKKQNTVDHGDNLNYNDLINFISSNNMASSQSFSEVLRRMDVDNFIDYQSAEIYYANQDWPWTNINFWRKKVQYTPNSAYGHDGRWRWSMHDIDRSAGSHFNLDLSSSYNALNIASLGGGWQTLILNKLLENIEFKNQFIIRNADLLNTSFSKSYINPLIDDTVNDISPAMPDHIKRWKHPLENESDPVSTDYWMDRVNKLKTWISERGYYHRLHIKEKFNLSDNEVTLDISDKEAGYIRINTIDVKENTKGIEENPYPWTGKYFKNINSLLIAYPNIGYKFNYWLVNGNRFYNDTLNINSSASTINIKCFFKENLYSENMTPLAFNMKDCFYKFSEWSSESSPGAFPKAMKFVYMDSTEPTMNASITDATFGAYNLSSRTRVNGLGPKGVSFINTGNIEGNFGFPGTKLGGLILAINTEGVQEMKLNWIGRTIEPNERNYAIRIQYRIGDIVDFIDLIDENDNIIEYSKQNNAGDSLVFKDIKLPSFLLDKPYVQLFWRYYSSNEGENGSRPQLAVDDIELETIKSLMETQNIGIDKNFSRISSSVSIPSNIQESYYAFKSILLKPGFTTHSNVNFRAEIVNCIED